MDADKLAKSATSNGKPPEPGTEDTGAPGHIGANGQHSSYWVLSESERAKGFVRPVRRRYRHVGIRPAFPLRDLTPEEVASTEGCDYVKFEPYPQPNPDGSSVIGKYWTAKQLKSGCDTATTMGQAIAETYARDPGYYGSTFCCGCGIHLPVGRNGEFVWDDGSGEKVGT